MNEIVSLKKMSDLHDRDSARRDLQVHQYKSEADKGLTALQEAERKVQNYRVEVQKSTHLWVMHLQSWAFNQSQQGNEPNNVS